MNIEEALRWVDRNCYDEQVVQRLRSRKVARTLSNEVERLRLLLNDQLCTIKALNIGAGGEGSTTTENLTHISRLEYENERLLRGEYICQRCGLRKNDDHAKADF